MFKTAGAEGLRPRSYSSDTLTTTQGLSSVFQTKVTGLCKTLFNQTTEEYANFLFETAIFKGLKKESLRSIAVTLKKKELKSSEILFRQGDQGDEANSVFFVYKGAVQVVAESSTKGEIPLATLQMGQSVGEMSRGAAMRSATVRALPNEPATLLEMKGQTFQDLLRTNKKLKKAFLLIIHERIKNSNESTPGLALGETQIKRQKNILPKTSEQPLPFSEAIKELFLGDQIEKKVDLLYSFACELRNFRDPSKETIVQGVFILLLSSYPQNLPVLSWVKLLYVSTTVEKLNNFYPILSDLCKINLDRKDRATYSIYREATIFYTINSKLILKSESSVKENGPSKIDKNELRENMIRHVYLLKKCSLFSSFKFEKRLEIVSNAKELVFQKNEQIIQEGTDAVDGMYIITNPEGEVQIHKKMAHHTNEYLAQ